MYENREVWLLGRQVTFHPNQRNPHRGFVYFPARGGRLYGTIELTDLGWTFTSHRAAQRDARAADRR